MCVNNLPKVVTPQRPGAELNLRPWVTSGLQVRHVTVRLPSSQSINIGPIAAAETMSSVLVH